MTSPVWLGFATLTMQVCTVLGGRWRKWRDRVVPAGNDGLNLEGY